MSQKRFIAFAIALWLTGSLVFALALATGASLFDGLFGEYQNQPWQNGLLYGGFYLAIGGWVAAAILSVRALYTKWGSYNHFVLITATCISLVLFVFSLYVFISW